MAKSTKAPPKNDNLTEFPAPETGIAIEDPPEPHDTDAEVPPPAPSEPAVAKSPGRPKKTDPSPETDFFVQVAAVRPTDWGTRVYLYLYQLEPVCDLKKSGGKSYLMRYEEPVTDEHRIMMEQGSGRYRFILAKNKISSDASNEMARYEFEIYNRLYPPKLNREAWVPDPRNRRWEALLPKEAAPAAPASGADTLMQAMRITGDLRKELKEELKPEAAPAAAAPVDPWNAAEKILNMRSENPMVAILQQQMKDNAAAAEAERARQFTAAEAAKEREFKLQQQLLEAKTAVVPAAPAKDLLGQLTDLANISDKLGPLKKLFGGGDGSGDVARVGRTTPLDVAREIGTKILEGPVGEGLGNWLSSLATRGPQPTMNGNPSSQVARTGPDPLFVFIEKTATPAMMRYFLGGATGEDFADWMDGGFPDELEQLQQFTHPMMPGLQGVEAIIQGYKHTPTTWNRIMQRGEAAFREFITKFCEWKPEPEEPVQDVEIVAGPIDLDANEGRSES